jgi:diaminopimelate decarboxylase
MHLLGVNFDCASAGEIRACLSVGASPSDIIYANPAKGFSHIEYAKQQGVKKMTFDNKEELHKIKKIFPDAELVLRIAANDSKVCYYYFHLTRDLPLKLNLICSSTHPLTSLVINAIWI